MRTLMMAAWCLWMIVSNTTGGALLSSEGGTLVLAAARVAGTENEDDTGSAATPAAAGSSLDASNRLAAAANGFIGTVSRNVPGTNKGRLACAWAVSQMLKKAGLINGSDASNSVDTLISTLKKKGWKEVAIDPDTMRPGDVIKWMGKKKGSGESFRHIGVYWGNRQAISNSSADGKTTDPHDWQGRIKGMKVVMVLRAPGN